MEITFRGTSKLRFKMTYKIKPAAELKFRGMMYAMAPDARICYYSEELNCATLEEGMYKGLLLAEKLDALALQQYEYARENLPKIQSVIAWKRKAY